MRQVPELQPIFLHTFVLLLETAKGKVAEKNLRPSRLARAPPSRLDLLCGAALHSSTAPGRAAQDTSDPRQGGRFPVSQSKSWERARVCVRACESVTLGVWFCFVFSPDLCSCHSGQLRRAFGVPSQATLRGSVCLSWRPVSLSRVTGWETIGLATEKKESPRWKLDGWKTRTFPSWSKTAQPTGVLKFSWGGNGGHLNWVIKLASGCRF